MILVCTLYPYIRIYLYIHIYRRYCTDNTRHQFHYLESYFKSRRLLFLNRHEHGHFHHLCTIFNTNEGTIIQLSIITKHFLLYPRLYLYNNVHYHGLGWFKWLNGLGWLTGSLIECNFVQKWGDGFSGAIMACGLFAWLPLEWQVCILLLLFLFSNPILVFWEVEKGAKFPFIHFLFFIAKKKYMCGCELRRRHILPFYGKGSKSRILMN